MNVTFFGADKFSTFALKGLLHISKNINSLNIYTTMPNSHRGENSVVEFCQQNDLNYQKFFGKNLLQNKAEFEMIVSEINHRRQQQQNNQILLLCSFGIMIPNLLIDAFQNKCFVVHPSLLPELPGCSPISSALLTGKNKTGTSIITMSKDKFDAGEIVLQKSLNIDVSWRYPELYDQLGNLTQDMMAEFIPNVDQFLVNKKKQVVTEEQTKKIKPADNYVETKKMTAGEILNRFRGFYGTSVKTVYFILRNHEGRFFVDECRVVDPHWYKQNIINENAKNIIEQLPIGTILNGFNKKGGSIFVKCQSGILEISKMHWDQKGSLTLSQLKDTIFKGINRHAFKQMINEPTDSEAADLFTNYPKFE